jgi:signal transduction histidine kinase
MAEHDKVKGNNFIVLFFAMLSFVLGGGCVGVALHALITGSDDIIDNIQIFASVNLMVVIIINLLIAILFLSIGLGLWFLRGWSKTILSIISGLGVVIFPLKGLILASSLAGKHFKMNTSDIVAVIFSILGVILSVFILWFISRPEVILAFEAREMDLIKAKIRSTEEKIALGRKRCSEGEISKAELSKLRSDCTVEERLLRGKIRHLEKLRLSRERAIKEKSEKREEKKKEKAAKKEEKLAQKEEEEAEKSEKKRAKEEEEKEEKKPEKIKKKKVKEPEKAEKEEKEEIKKKKVKEPERAEEEKKEEVKKQKRVKKTAEKKSGEVEKKDVKKPEEVKKRRRVKKVIKEESGEGSEKT